MSSSPRVCMVLLSGIGDVVHGLPVAKAIKAQHPNAEILWVAEPAPAQVLENHPAVDRVVVYQKRAGWRGLRELWRELRGTRFNLTLNMQRYAKSVPPTLFSRAPRRVGLPPSKTRDGIRFIHTECLPEGPWKHTQDLFLDFLPAIGIERPGEVQWDITFSESEEVAASNYFEQFDDGMPLVGLVLATANRRKDWPAERYVGLADALEKELGFRVLLLGGPSDLEGAVAAHIVHEGLGNPQPALGDSVRELMWKVRGCDLVISPDTGPLHVAHAMGVPVIGLFGHTNPWRLGPYNRYRDLFIDRYTDDDQEASPIHYDPKYGRMERISVRDVMEKVQWAIDHYGVRGRSG